MYHSFVQDLGDYLLVIHGRAYRMNCPHHTHGVDYGEDMTVWSMDVQHRSMNELNKNL